VPGHELVCAHDRLSVRHQDGHRHARQQAAAGPSAPAPARASGRRGHHDQVDAVVGRTRQDHAADIGIGRDVALDRDLDAVSDEPRGDVGTGSGPCPTAEDLGRRLERRPCPPRPGTATRRTRPERSRGLRSSTA
jgi:hypothetical protein